MDSVPAGGPNEAASETSGEDCNHARDRGIRDRIGQGTEWRLEGELGEDERTYRAGYGYSLASGLTFTTEASRPRARQRQRARARAGLAGVDALVSHERHGVGVGGSSGVIPAMRPSVARRRRNDVAEMTDGSEDGRYGSVDRFAAASPARSPVHALVTARITRRADLIEQPLRRELRERLETRVDDPLVGVRACAPPADAAYTLAHRPPDPGPVGPSRSNSESSAGSPRTTSTAPPSRRPDPR